MAQGGGARETREGMSNYGMDQFSDVQRMLQHKQLVRTEERVRENHPATKLARARIAAREAAARAAEQGLWVDVAPEEEKPRLVAAARDPPGTPGYVRQLRGQPAVPARGEAYCAICRTVHYSSVCDPSTWGPPPNHR